MTENIARLGDAAQQAANVLYSAENGGSNGTPAKLRAAMRALIEAADAVANPVQDEPKRTGPVSGDHCRILGDGLVEHYRCDEHADGTIQNVVTGEVTRRAPAGALRGFDR